MGFQCRRKGCKVEEGSKERKTNFTKKQIKQDVRRGGWRGWEKFGEKRGREEEDLQLSRVRQTNPKRVRGNGGWKE